MGFVGVAAVTTNPLLAGRAHAAAAAGRQRAEPDRCRPGRPVRPTGWIGCHTSWPLPSAVLVDHARAPCLHRAAMIGIADPVRAETALAAGTLACPGCARPLRPWGHARTRTVRDHGTTTLALRPRRARCRTCRVTHVLLPTAATLRRADSTAVIGSALLASARGAGYRRIAAELDRPVSTVRRWRATPYCLTDFGWVLEPGTGSRTQTRKVAAVEVHVRELLVAVQVAVLRQRTDHVDDTGQCPAK